MLGTVSENTQLSRTRTGCGTKWTSKRHLPRRWWRK